MLIDLSPRVRVVTVETSAADASQAMRVLVVVDPCGQSWTLEFEPGDKVIGTRTYETDGILTIELQTWA
jgi:hypothetical protein